MTIREAILDWPNLSWVGSYAGADKLDVDPDKAIIEKVELVRDTIRLTVKVNGRLVSAAACLPDRLLLNKALTL
jgi:hypothetical protein